MRKLRIILLAVVLPVFVIGGCAAAAVVKLRPKPDKPRTAQVQRGDIVVTVRETGYVEPEIRVEVKSKVAGRLAQLAVEEGDEVVEGQLIARLEVPELEAQRDQIRAQLAAAQARLDQARLSLAQSRELIESQIEQAEASLNTARAGLEEAQTRRADAERVYENKKRLFEMGGYVSQNEVDSAKAALDLAARQVQTAQEHVREQEAAKVTAQARRKEVDVGRSRVVEAEAQVRQIRDSLAEIESRLADSVIRAPRSGVVIARHVREGELITAVSYYGAGAPIVTIGDLSTMLVKVNLNEVDVDKVRLGQKAQVTADALPGKKFTGVVSRLSPASTVEAQSPGIVKFPVEITIQGPHGDLRTGMTANVEIACQRANGVLWVPNEALFQKKDQEGKWFCSVVTGEKNGKLVTEDREVTKGLATDSRTEIKSGLKEKEKVELGKAGIPERKKIDIRRESERREEEG